MILGMLWLACHNPEIDWRIGEVKMTRCVVSSGGQSKGNQDGKSKRKKRKRKKKQKTKRERAEGGERKEKEEKLRKKRTMEVKRVAEKWEI